MRKSPSLHLYLERSFHLQEGEWDRGAVDGAGKVSVETVSEIYWFIICTTVPKWRSL